MIRMSRHPIFALMLVTSSMSACKKPHPDLQAYKDEALGAVIKYGPQLTELGNKFADLVKRAKALPANSPGREDLNAMLDAQKASLTKLQSSMSTYADDIGTAVKNGSKMEIEHASTALVTQFQASMGDLGAALKNVEARLDKLESDAKAQTPPAVGADAAATAK